MSQVNFRIDDDVKTDAEALFNRLGMNMSTAIMVFIRQSLAENGIPFRIQVAPQVSERDRFVQAGIDYENGKVNYHYHDLPEMEENRPQRTRRAKALA